MTLQNFVGGTWTASTASSTVPVHNPSTGEIIAETPLSPAADVAAAVAAARKGLTDRQVTVELPGGVLFIDWTKDDRILMCGPAELEFEGTLTPDTLSRATV